MKFATKTLEESKPALSKHFFFFFFFLRKSLEIINVHFPLPSIFWSCTDIDIALLEDKRQES